jgi:hypothetical protein
MPERDENSRVLNGNIEGKRSFRRRNRGWKNIKLTEMRHGDVD